MKLRDDLDRSILADNYRDEITCFVVACKEAGIDESQIGLFGEVGYPGISDLDALVIANPAKLHKLRRGLAIREKSSQFHRYAFQHPPLMVLPSVVPDLASLHTLENLRPIIPHGLQQMRRFGPISRVLHVSWFTFLISTILNERVKTTSVRWRLLLYKNLVHSIEFFDGRSASSVEASAELRHAVFNATKGYLKRLETSFDEAVTVACAAADRYCANASFSGTRPNGGGVSIKLAGGQILEQGISTKLILEEKKIIANPTLFDMAVKFLRPRPEANCEISEYVETLHRTIWVYALAGLPNPFVTPFALQPRGIKGATFSALRRLMSKIPRL